MKMICTSIVEQDIDSMVNRANSAETEIVELRLDYLKDFSALEKVKGIKKRKIVTCMPSWEGGKFRGKEGERLEILNKAVRSAEFVTLELRMERKCRDGLIKSAKESGAKVIVAYHDFKSTPERNEIIRILNDEKNSKADIAKVAFMANNYEDVLDLMQVLVDKKSELGIPIIAISMGHFGRISRILSPLLGSYLTFASAGKGKESAEGQLTAEELQKILEILS
jgi:3-dehydroquinate dehydratase type I